MSGSDTVLDDVAWAVHCWSCPLCYVNGFEAMAASDQDHVTEIDRQFAAFLVGALGLVSAEVSVSAAPAPAAGPRSPPETGPADADGTPRTAPPPAPTDPTDE